MWFDRVSAAARKYYSLPDDWHAFKVEDCSGRGVLATGACCPLTTRGKRKGQPNWRKKDWRSEKRVFLSNEEVGGQ